MPNLEPIETKFKGYRFRSRLEAKWAVFFDNLDIVWRYEPEGFKLLNGEKYLPDFHLPASDLWLEIKPIKEGVDVWPSHPAFKYFSEDSPQDNFYVIKGRPFIAYKEYGFNERTLDYGAEQGYGAWPGYDKGYYFCECPRCGRIGIEFGGRANRIDCGCSIAEETHNLASDRLIKAYKKASSARFEHGKKPR